MGIVCGCIYLIVVFIFIPVPFGTYIVFNQEGFPHEKVRSHMVMGCYLWLLKSRF